MPTTERRSTRPDRPAGSRLRLSGAWVVGAATALAVLGLAPPAQSLVRQLDPSDGGTGAHFGFSVAMDGDTLVVGAPGAASSQGAVYVYTRTAGEAWTQSAKLTASDGMAGDALGYAVAIDGNTIVAGAPGDDDDTGSLYLFDRTGAANRTQSDHLLASDGADRDSLGQAVDIDGATIVAGAPGDDNDGIAYDAEHGSVYTFTTTGTAGRYQSAKLRASDNINEGYTGAGSSLGASVAIDGDVIVAGAPNDNYGHPTGTRRGSVYTFATTGAASRQETGKLSVAGTAYGRLGVSVDVLGDTIVAGDDDNADYGAVYTFARTGALERNQTAKLKASSQPAGTGFGASVSLSDEFIAVGAPSASNVGYGYVFTRTGAANRNEVWFTSGASSNNDQYGASIVTDGDRVVAGAPYVNATGPFVEDQGRVFSSTPDLYVTKAGNGTGTVTSTPTGQACGSSCFGSFLLGDQVTLTATPSSGSYFAGWSNDPACTGTGACAVTMDRQRQLVATFTVGTPPDDTTPPLATIGSGPAAGSTVTTSSVTFGFSASETSTFECAYDAAAYAPCTTPGPGTSGSDTRSNLSEGAHTFKVRARDLAGNLSTEQLRAFTVDLPSNPPPPPPPAADTTAPETTITKAPPKTVKAKRKATIEISFSASEAATFVCSVDGKAALPCSSSATFTLGLGKHTIEVVATDAAGNRDASPAKVEVKVKKKKKKK